MRDRNRQQLVFLVAFPLSLLVGFTLGRALGCSEPVVVGFVFLSGLFAVLGFFFGCHFPLTSEERSVPDRPGWVYRARVGTRLSPNELESLRFSLVNRALVRGAKHFLYLREEECEEGRWRQEIEIASDELCAYSLQFASRITMFGDEDEFVGKGHFLKPRIFYQPGP